MHSDFYKKNRTYAERLRDRDPREFQGLPSVCSTSSFHEKYIQALGAGRTPGSVIVDVGCGAGQVVRALSGMGFRANGIDVSEESISIAKEHGGDYQVFDGKRIPFTGEFADAIGAFNVLEHVDEPLLLLDEMYRVLKPGGRLVVSSPNFLRVLGYRDYHPRMRGVRQKFRNLATLARHSRLYTRDKSSVVFETLTPIQREPMQPDDDAIVATSAIDLRQYYCSRGMTKVKVSCVDRPVPIWMEKLLDLTPLRFFILNTFVTGEKTASERQS
jgi:2-polyprenyl-3-methyl-5-hydroxy-6-metoxy-1,4-benzoquinol methylase